MVKRFDSNSEPSARFHSSSSILLNPSLENATKTPLTKKTLGSKISGGRFQLIEIKFPKLRCNFQIFTNF